MATYISTVHLKLADGQVAVPGSVIEADGNDARIRGYREAGLITRTDDDPGAKTRPVAKPAKR